MRKIILLICFFMPVACMGGVLHVGNLEFQTFTTQQTEHAIVIMRDTGAMEYIPLTKKWYDGTLHVKMDEVIYSACNTIFRRDGHYFYCGDDLVAADDTVYLESTGTQYIDTGIPKNNGITFNMTINFLSCPNSYCMNGLLNDVQIGISRSGMWHTVSNGSRDTIFAEYNKWYETELICNNSKCDLYANGDFISSESFGVNNNGFAISATNSDFGANHYAYEKIRIFSVIDNWVAIREMVPVPAGLQIGNFTVPSNGMWDIVEQNFYGNSGTGEFIYGVDE